MQGQCLIAKSSSCKRKFGVHLQVTCDKHCNGMHQGCWMTSSGGALLFMNHVIGHCNVRQLQCLSRCIAVSSSLSLTLKQQPIMTWSYALLPSQLSHSYDPVYSYYEATGRQILMLLIMCGQQGSGTDQCIFTATKLLQRDNFLGTLGAVFTWRKQCITSAQPQPRHAVAPLGISQVPALLALSRSNLGYSPQCKAPPR